MYIAPGQGLTTPWGRKFDVTGTSCHFGHLLQVSKKSLWSLILYIFFHDFIHVYSPRAGANIPQGTKFWCQQKCLVTSFICYKFQKMSLKPDFIQFSSWFNTCIQPRGRDRKPQGVKILMSTGRPYHFTHLFEVWFYTLFFHDLIHAYSPGAGAYSPPGDEVLMSTETSCHFGHLLPVSNHRRQ